MASKDTSRRAVCRAEIDHAVVPPREATKPRDCGCPVCRRRVAADGEGFLLLLLLLLVVLLFLSLSLSCSSSSRFSKGKPGNSSGNLEAKGRRGNFG